ncbi:hypothetical protein NEUTE1DRAFT_42285, partial [Neurospora tetrasperma FGSC 2508]
IILGFIGFYKYFVILYSKVTAPFTELLKGNKRRAFELIEKTEKVFTKLK